MAVLAVLAAGKDGGSIPSLAVLAVLAVPENIEIARSIAKFENGGFGGRGSIPSDF